MAPIHTGGNGPSSVEMSATNYGGSATASSPKLAAIFRLIVVVLTFIASIVMGVAKQTSNEYQATVKFSQSSSFVYFVIANVLVCLYSALAIGFSFISSSSRGLKLALVVADLLAAGFLFTSNAAAMAVDVLARNGNKDFGWDKFCNIVDKFCGQVTAAIVLSSLANIVYVVLLVVFIVKGSR